MKPPLKRYEESSNVIAIDDADGMRLCQIFDDMYDECTAQQWETANAIVRAINFYLADPVSIRNGDNDN